MDTRLTRTDAAARNRILLMQAARRVFLERGFSGATLDAIAREAGFSKGVVYSQFDSKSDLFLALLEERQAERSRIHAEAAQGLAGLDGVLELLRIWDRDRETDAPWTLLVVEFRVQAAREPAVNARYAALHERTVAGVASTLETLFDNAALEVPLPAALLARAVLALSVGVALERAADVTVLPVGEVRQLLAQLLSATASAASPAARRNSR